MAEEPAYAFGKIYFAIFGLIVLGFGAAEIILGLSGKGFEWGILEMSGEFLLWRGLILFFTGLFYISSVKKFSDVHQQAKVVLASIMIWLIAGMQIFGMMMESIPGGEDGGWFNTPEGFLATYSAPYIPSLFLLPFSLVTIYYIKLRGKLEKSSKKKSKKRVKRSSKKKSKTLQG